MTNLSSDMIASIIEMFLLVEYPWKPLLIQQLRTATTSFEIFDDACYVIYAIPADCEKIVEVPRVPLSILIENGTADSSYEILQNPQYVNFSGICAHGHIACNVHIVNGYLHEIELFTLDGTKLNLEGIFERKRYYIIHN